MLALNHIQDMEKERALIAAFLGSTLGAFIEVGANHPQEGSQTYHLEQAGWTGILVEPQKRLATVLRESRPGSYVVEAACTSASRRGLLTLHIPSEDGFATVEPNKDDFGVSYTAVEQVPARTLDEIIEEWREATGSAARIRFISIDVEGHEEDVLSGLSLRRHQPDLVLVEDKLQDLSKHRLLRSMGYRLVRRTSLNNWYIPASARPPARSHTERLLLFRKVFLGLPFRALRRWRKRVKAVAT